MYDTRQILKCRKSSSRYEKSALSLQNCTEVVTYLMKFCISIIHSFKLVNLPCSVSNLNWIIFCDKWNLFLKLNYATEDFGLFVV